MDWPKALRDYRRRHGLTQAALAEALGVDPTTVSRWERGRDQPALGIARRLTSLVVPHTSDVERALKVLIDTSNTIVVLYDNKYRVLWSSPKHRELLRIDASELYGKPFERFQSNSQAELVESLGGPAGWLRNGIARIECSLLRHAFERAPNPRAYAQRGVACTIRDGLESPMVLAITNEIPLADYRPMPPVVRTLDDPVDALTDFQHISCSARPGDESACRSGTAGGEGPADVRAQQGRQCARDQRGAGRGRIR
jgi:transcriptional regulator with XRE-family HTH domain